MHKSVLPDRDQAAFQTHQNALERLNRTVSGLQTAKNQHGVKQSKIVGAFEDLASLSAFCAQANVSLESVFGQIKRSMEASTTFLRAGFGPWSVKIGVEDVQADPEKDVPASEIPVVSTAPGFSNALSYTFEGEQVQEAFALSAFQPLWDACQTFLRDMHDGSVPVEERPARFATFQNTFKELLKTTSSLLASQEEDWATQVRSAETRLLQRENALVDALNVFQAPDSNVWHQFQTLFQQEKTREQIQQLEQASALNALSKPRKF